MYNRRIVVTSLGSLSAAGNSQELWHKIMKKQSCLEKNPLYHKETHPVQVFGRVNGNLEGSFPRSYKSFLSRHCLLAAGALEECLEGAQLSEEALRDSGLVFGSASQGMERAMEVQEQLHKKPFPKVNYHLLNSISDSGACHLLASNYGIGGYVHSVSGASCSGLIALQAAAHAIESGQHKRVFCLSGEANLFPATYLFYSRRVFFQGASYSFFGKVENPQERSPEDYVQPFGPPNLSDRGAIAEGAGALLLESEEAALDRNAPILGVLGPRAFHFYADKRHGVDKERIGLRRVLDSLSSANIDSIYLPVTGSYVMDAGLIESCGEAFQGQHCFSPEPIIGHTGGATSLINGVLALKSFQERCLPPTSNFQEERKNSQCALNPKASPQLKELKSILLMSTGWGGYNGGCVLESYP